MAEARGSLGCGADYYRSWVWVFFFFQAEDGIRDLTVTGVQTCALPIFRRLLASTIEAAGAELAGSSTGAPSAIADLAVLRPDLILIDIRLSSGSGFDEIGRASCRERV